MDFLTWPMSCCIGKPSQETGTVKNTVGKQIRIQNGLWVFLPVNHFIIKLLSSRSYIQLNRKHSENNRQEDVISETICINWILFMRILIGAHSSYVEETIVPISSSENATQLLKVNQVCLTLESSVLSLYVTD